MLVKISVKILSLIKILIKILLLGSSFIRLKLLLLYSSLKIIMQSIHLILIEESMGVSYF